MWRPKVYPNEEFSGTRVQLQHSLNSLTPIGQELLREIKPWREGQKVIAEILIVDEAYRLLEKIYQLIVNKLGLVKEELLLQKLAEVPLKILIQKLVFPLIYPSVFQHYITMCKTKDESYLAWREKQKPEHRENEYDFSETVRSFNTIVTKHSPAEKIDLLYNVYLRMKDLGEREDHIALELMSHCNLEHLVAEIAFLSEFYPNFPRHPTLEAQVLGNNVSVVIKQDLQRKNKLELVYSLLQSFRRFVENPSYDPKDDWPTESLINTWTGQLNNSQLEFYVPQFSYLMMQEKVSQTFENFMVEKCTRDLHFAAKMQMQLRVLLEDEMIDSKANRQLMEKLNDLIDQVWRPVRNPLAYYKNQFLFVHELESLALNSREKGEVAVIQDLKFLNSSMNKRQVFLPTLRYTDKFHIVVNSNSFRI